MAITITYLGHSGFLFSDGAMTIAVDPFLTGNPMATMKADEITCDYIAITHGHEDHVGDTVAIAKKNKAIVAANFEITEYFLPEQGVEKTEQMNPGGKVATPFGWIALTQAFHSSSHGGRYMGQPCGLIINIGAITIYHCGDTTIFGDMALLGHIYKPDVACIPIGDRFTMGPELASRAAELIKPKVAIPIHYNTWPPIAQDPAKFQPRDVEAKVMKPGEVWKYGP